METLEEQIRIQSSIALTVAILGSFFLGIFLEPFAIHRANRVLNLIRENNIGKKYELRTRSARGIAIIFLIIWSIVILSYFAISICE